MNLYLVVCDDGGGEVVRFFCIWRITQVRVCPLESRNSARRRRRHRATWAEDTFINQNHYYRARVEGKQQATHSHSTIAYQANNTQTQNMVPEQAQLSNIISTSAYAPACTFSRFSATISTQHATSTITSTQFC